MAVVREDRTPFRRPTNVSLDSRRFEDASMPDIVVLCANLNGLQRETKAERERRWLEENREAIAEYNDWARSNDLPLAKYRVF